MINRDQVPTPEARTGDIIKFDANLLGDEYIKFSQFNGQYFKVLIPGNPAICAITNCRGTVKLPNPGCIVIYSDSTR